VQKKDSRLVTYLVIPVPFRRSVELIKFLAFNAKSRDFLYICRIFPLRKAEEVAGPHRIFFTFLELGKFAPTGNSHLVLVEGKGGGRGLNHVAWLCEAYFNAWLTEKGINFTETLTWDFRPLFLSPLKLSQVPTHPFFHPITFLIRPWIHCEIRTGMSL
jgi:hypothetical protein